MHERRLILEFNGESISGEGELFTLECRGQADFFEELRTRLADYREKYPDGGAIGFFGYETARLIEPRAFTREVADDLGLPLARLTFYRQLRRARLTRHPSDTLKLQDLPDGQESREFYENGVRQIRDLIAAGDIYQANLTRRFEFETPYSVSQIAARLASLGRAPHAALLEWDDFSVVSNSPETFLTLKNGILESKPIKGTVRRGLDGMEDDALKSELRDSQKNRAENVMIVDLLRNDLGRICEFGSVHVPKLYEIETYPTLHHGVSTVRGKLRQDCDALDAFKAAFPCGSITGAPKIRAMQILSELEPVRRGVSMGAIGYFAFNGDMEWSVAIRTATIVQNRAYFHVGGGIVADSEPQEEYEEMRLKGRALFSAITGD